MSSELQCEDFPGHIINFYYNLNLFICNVEKNIILLKRRVTLSSQGPSSSN